MDLGRVKAAYGRFEQFTKCDLWSEELYLRWSKPHQRVWLHVLRDTYLIIRGVFFRDQLRLHAAALTFVTLLSLVPALAVVFSLFAAFGGLDDAKAQLQSFLVDLLAVSQREKILGYLEGFVSGVHAGAIGGFGLLFLFVTAITLLGDIERAFNAIWGVNEERSFFRRFQRYWPVLTLGPPLIGISLSATASVQASAFVQELVARVPLMGSAISLVSVVFTIAGFFMAYTVLPNTKVRLSSALVGGVVGGLLWEVAKRVYAVYTKEAISYSAIYGSVAFIPLTIIWVYVSWLLVLTGAMVAFAFQNARTFQPELVGERLPPRERERIASTLLLAVHQRFGKGRGATSEETLLARWPGAPRAVRQMLTQLVEGQLLLVVQEHEDGTGCATYIPGRPAEHTTLADIYRLVHGDPDKPRAVRDEGKRGVPNEALNALEQVEADAIHRLESVTLAELLRAHEDEDRVDVEKLAAARPRDPGGEAQAAGAEPPQLEARPEPARR